MEFSKQIQEGPATITIAQKNGVASLKVEAAVANGGIAPGALTAKVSAEVDLSDAVAAELALTLLEVKVPALKGLIDGTIKPAVAAALAPPAPPAA